MAQTKFKVGDRVKDKEFGIGTVKFNEGKSFMPYIVEFDTPTFIPHRPFCKDYHGAWCSGETLKALKE